MKTLSVALAVLLAFGCGRQKQKPIALTYLGKEDVLNRDSVRRFLASVPETQGDSSRASFLKGIDLLKNGGKAKAAAEALVQSLTVYPSANGYYELGNAYLQTKSWKKALQSFEMAEGLDYQPLGASLMGQASAYAGMDSVDKAYAFLRYAVQSGYVDRAKILAAPQFTTYKNDGYMLTVYNEAMSGNGDPEEILWQGYTQDFKPASFPYGIDSGSFRTMGEPKIISYDYEKFIPEMRDNKFSRDVGSEYFYVARVAQTELCSVVLYGCRSYEYSGAPVHYVLASFNSRGKLIDKMVVGGAKNFTDNYKEFTAQSVNRFQVQEYANTYEKNTDENGFEDNKVVSRSLIGTKQYTIDATGKFVAA